MRGCSSEWSDLIGPCYLQCLAQALVVCVTRLLSVRFESLGPRLLSLVETTISFQVLPCMARTTERIIGPWGSFNFGPQVYLSLYIICCMKALVCDKGGGVWGFSPRKNYKNT